MKAFIYEFTTTFSGGVKIYKSNLSLRGITVCVTICSLVKIRAVHWV